MQHSQHPIPTHQILLHLTPNSIMLFCTNIVYILIQLSISMTNTNHKSQNAKGTLCQQISLIDPLVMIPIINIFVSVKLPRVPKLYFSIKPNYISRPKMFTSPHISNYF